jgi:hypothetical protein
MHLEPQGGFHESTRTNHYLSVKISQSEYDQTAQSSLGQDLPRHQRQSFLFRAPIGEIVQRQVEL